MKRPTRPFVVEVKKTRGGPPKLRSIWGDLDLSVLADDTLAVTALTSEPAGNDRVLDDPVVEVECVSDTGLVIETPSDDRDPHAITDANYAELHATAAETEGARDRPARPPRKRLGRRDEPTFPRGQRWKRRLPKALCR